MSDCESIASGRAAPLAVAKDLTSRVGADLIRLRRPAASLTWREPVFPTLPTGSSNGALRPLTFPSRLRDPVDRYGALFFLFFSPPFSLPVGEMEPVPAWRRVMRLAHLRGRARAAKRLPLP